MANSGKKVKQLLALREVFNETPKLLFLKLILYHLDFLGPGRRSISLPGPVGLLDLPFNVFRLRVRCPRDDPGVGKTCFEQVGEDKDEEDGADDRDNWGDPLCEERTVEGKEEAGGADDQEKGDIEDARLQQSEMRKN